MASNPAEATIVTTERHRPADPGAVGEQASHAAMHADLERLLAAARPGLSRVARRQGVAPDAVEDVVQETLLTAWRSLGQLRSPERFDAWLAGICRNVGRHQRRAAGRLARRQVPFADVSGDPWDDAGGRGGLCGREQEALLSVPFDFAEDLARRDLEALLDRALAHLSAGAREALHLCDLLETPQREAALRLGLTVDALEQRLLRARRQLRAVLHGTLRADAAAFGLLLDADPATGWRETREWCMLCGRQRMRGLFDPRPDGRVRLRMRCPACSPRHGGAAISSTPATRSAWTARRARSARPSGAPWCS
jgi:RNA polymerase sigma factor (sigma-70 family)